MLYMIFANDEFNNELQIEMSQILLHFIEANKHLFSPRVLRAIQNLRNEIERLEDNKYIKEAS